MRFLHPGPSKPGSFNGLPLHSNANQKVIDTPYTSMLFFPVFIAADTRSLASFPSVAPVCPASPYAFPASLSHFPSFSKPFRMIYLQKSIKIKDYNSIRIIDLQKTWGEGVVIVK